jgi:hypothetical protein
VVTWVTYLAFLFGGGGDAETIERNGDSSRGVFIFTSAGPLHGYEFPPIPGAVQVLERLAEDPYR